MRIDRYFDAIKAVIDRFRAAPFIIESNVKFEARPGDQGYLTGSILFIDGSFFNFSEFIDIEGETLEKVSYSYHYQNHRHQMIFRYDNANHKPVLVSPEHKHTPEGVVAAEAPALEDVFMEIMAYGGINEDQE